MGQGQGQVKSEPPGRTHTARELADLVMMKRGEPGWPNWPFLPVVKRQRHTHPVCGVLFDRGPLTGKDRGVKVHPTVYAYNVFDVEKTFDQTKVVAKYETFEDLIRDGWEVD